MSKKDNSARKTAARIVMDAFFSFFDEVTFFVI